MVPIKRNISSFNHSSRYGRRIEYIVIHFTGNYTDSDENNALYFNAENRDASAHYFIDADSITQVVEDVNASWQCGDGYGKYGITNQNSLGIELCGTNGTISDATMNNALEFVKMKMEQYGVSIDKVVRHYDASRKSCPSPWMANDWAKWKEFKSRLSGVETPAEVPVNTTVLDPDVFYQVRNHNGQYLPFVKNQEDYAGSGNLSTPIDAVRCYPSGGSVLYKVHTIEGNKWYPYVENLSDFAGVYGQRIDGIIMVTKDMPHNSIMYRVYAGGKWLPWVRSDYDYAGILGYPIMGIEVKII